MFLKRDRRLYLVAFTAAVFVMGRAFTPVLATDEKRRTETVLQSYSEQDQLNPKKPSRLENIIEVDDRRRIETTNQYPWSTVCKLKVTFSDGARAEGTGTMVGPHHVLTAGHCVIDKEHGWAESVEVIPGYNGAEQPFGNAGKKMICSFAGWFKAFDPKFDLAMVITDSDIGSKTGWMGMQALGDEELRTMRVHTSGYPGDKDRAQRLYYAAGSLKSFEERRLHYKIATWSGQSGSALYERKLAAREDEEADRWVFGVHTMGGPDENSGTRITPDVMKHLSDWRNDRINVGK